VTPEGGPDLTPRPGGAVAAKRRRRAWGTGVVLALLLGVGAIVLYQGLSDATTFFCNADEIGRADGCRGNGRLRLQGVVDNGSLAEDAGVLHFSVSYGGATVPVTYRGDPGGIFREGIPVVVEGRMGDTAFAGDRILVKHTEQYVEENPGRVPEGAP
jgi:cytochrome c-type biogenesis protein CcmE